MAGGCNRGIVRPIGFTLLALTAFICGRVAFGKPWPAWSSDRQHRLLVNVEPVHDVKRAVDEMVARVHIDFGEYLKQQQADLSSLQVVGISPDSIQPMDFASNPNATTRGERPWRLYDDTDSLGLSRTRRCRTRDGWQGNTRPHIAGRRRFFNTLGDGKSGQLAWAHTQTGKQPTNMWFTSIRFSPARGVDSRQPVSLATARIAAPPCRIRLRPVLQGRVGMGDLNGDGLFDLIMGNLTGTILFGIRISVHLASRSSDPVGCSQPTIASRSMGWS